VSFLNRPEVVGSFLPVAARDLDAVIAFGPRPAWSTENAGDAACTFGDFLTDVANVVGQIPAVVPSSDLDLPPHVAIVCDDRYAFAVAVVAVWQAGYAVALPPSARPAAVATVMARPEVFTLIHNRDGGDGISLRAALGQPGPRAQLSPVRGDRVIATFFTSGSSGEFQASPKLASQLFVEAAALQYMFELKKDWHVVATVAPHHLYGFLLGVLWPLTAGVAFVRDVPLHAEAIADRAALGDPERAVIVTVPAHLRSFETIAPGRLRGRVFASTAPLSPALVADLAPHALDLCEIFGSTETGGIAWRRWPVIEAVANTTTDGVRGAAAQPSWRPFHGVTLAVEPDDDSPELTLVGYAYDDCRPATGTVGRLQVTSPYADRTAEGPFRTADRVALAADGTFTHLGRADDVVKVGGRRVALSHLEARLRGLPGVQDATVIALPDAGQRNARLMAALVAPGCSAEGLREALLQWFDLTSLPKRFVFVAALPREPNGKLTRERVLALFKPKPRSRLTLDWDDASRRRTDAHTKAGTKTTVYSVALVVPPDLFYFEGHFPEMPILPGITLVHCAVLREIARVCPDLSGLRRMTRLKFRRPIRPADQLELELTRAHQSSDIDFQIRRGTTICASGRLSFGAL